MKEFNELDEQIKEAESFLFSKGIDSNGRKIVVSDQAELAKQSLPDNPLNYDGIEEQDSIIENDLTRLMRDFGLSS